MQNMKSVTIKEFNKIVKSQKLRDIINNLYAKDHDILIYYGLIDESNLLATISNIPYSDSSHCCTLTK